MQLTLTHFLIVCPLVFLAGFVDSIAGGGGLISLPAYLIAGLPTHFAIATNKLSSSMGTTIATVQYARKGYIPWKLAVGCVVFAYLGSTMGARLALMIDDYYFKIIMLIVLPLTGAYVLLRKDFLDEREPYPLLKTLAMSAAVSLVIGMYDGFYGPGTGTFLLLFLTGVAHVKLSQANGTSKVINLTTNIASLVVYLTNGKVLLPLGLAAGAFSIAGNYLGSRTFVKGGAKSVKPVMIVVLVIFFIKALTEVLSGT